eukprot:TRINITY_DN8176_c0_g1_i2.p1 TRINITY_DN8176_c0_g1~~TRINITY_DN8176_c0_g1_i2.p1  ORF type:complete len:375 (+),score=98.66 TRINITY_DN8176_c0_g1_i2:66-1190(+)
MESHCRRVNTLSPRPLDLERRTRRISAPAAAMPGAPGPYGQGLGSSGLRQWVTTCAAAWRTAPSSMGYRIDTLPRGWQVVEAPWAEDPVAGWVPIEPRGFLQLCDLAKAAEAPAPEEEVPESSMMMTPQASSKGGSESGTPASCSSTQEGTSAAGTRAALLALREEHVRLREANVQLREKEMKKRQELDSLSRAREAAAKELAQVRNELAAEHEELEHSRQQRRTLQEKLDRCREAIASAVSSVDRLYGLQVDAEEDLSGSEEGPVVARARQQRMKKAADLAEQATAAGEVVSAMIDEVANSSEDDREGNLKAPSAIAAYDEYSSSHENADALKVVKKAEERSSDAAVRRSSSDAADKIASRQRAPLRDLNLGC